MTQPSHLTRRRFLAASAAGSVLSMNASSYARIYGASERLNVAFVAAGGIATGQHIGQIAGLGAGCPAYADA
ncbi:MAG: hypothetical protein OSB57_14815, partial [Planctomycetota bacterium]|nr:hypothetical protein [Planctomycetota bacterium]